MTLDFVKTGIGRAENGDGAVVRGAGKELLVYERGDFSTAVEINFVDDEAIIFRPTLPAALPAGLSEADVLEEIRAGARIVARRPVRWS